MTRFILLALLLCIVPDAVAQRYQGSTTRTDGTNETTVAPDAVIVNGDTVMIRVDYDSNEDGKLDLAAIPSLPASLITSGEVPDARIADAITISSSGSVSGTAVDGGTVDEAYLDADVALYKGLRTNNGNYTFQAGDEERIVLEQSTSGALSYKLPVTSATFATGDVLTVVAGSAFTGSIAFTGNVGVTVNNAPTIDAAGETAVFVVTGTDEYFGVQGGGSGGGASQLTDLSDVGTATPTNRFSLFGDGSVFKARNIQDADLPVTIARTSQLDTLSVFGTVDPQDPGPGIGLDRLYRIQRTGSAAADSGGFYSGVDSLFYKFAIEFDTTADTLFFVASGGGGGGSYTTVYFEDTFTEASDTEITSHTPNTAPGTADANWSYTINGDSLVVETADDWLESRTAPSFPGNTAYIDLGEAQPSAWRVRFGFHTNGSGVIDVCYGVTDAQVSDNTPTGGYCITLGTTASAALDIGTTRGASDLVAGSGFTWSTGTEYFAEMVYDGDTVSGSVYASDGTTVLDSGTSAAGQSNVTGDNVWISVRSTNSRITELYIYE